jgi:hypothetical protein
MGVTQHEPAIQEGKYVPNLIGLRVEGKSSPKPFWYWEKAVFVSRGQSESPQVARLDTSKAFHSAEALR